MKLRSAQVMFLMLVMSSAAALFPVKAQAGFFDALTSAANKLNSAAQNMEQKSQAAADNTGGGDADHPLNFGNYSGSCQGHRTATCMDYNEAMDQCMAPVYGYRMKVLGDRIEYELKNGQFSDQQRKNLQEDLAAAREAEKNKSDEPTIAGQAKSQRYLSDISDEDQIWVNAEFGRFRNRIYNKCEGADHMGVGHRTELITDFGPTGDEAVAQYRKDHPPRRHHSYGVGGNGGSGGCNVAGLRYTIMADMMEKKMQGLHLSAKEKSDWMMDIAAVRATAAAGGMSMPTVPDPQNPYRPLTRLSSPDEQMALNNEFVKQSRDCRGR